MTNTKTITHNGKAVEREKLNAGKGIQRALMTANQVRELVENATLLRAEMIRDMLDPRRDINDECGYPQQGGITEQQYGEMYDREGIATRVVSILPEESWKHDPDVYEDEDPNTETEFEKAWDDLLIRFRIWHYLERLDILSGIGQYGILLLGFDDGKDLAEPLDGVPEIPDPNEPLTQSGGQHKLLYLRPFEQRYIRATTYESDPKNPRFGQPNTYSILFSNIEEYNTAAMGVSGQGGQIAQQTTQQTVHWTRVIHVADNLSTSEIYGVPRMQSVFNRLMDIRKIMAADGEGCWQGGFPGLAVETQPGLENVEFDEEATKKQMQDYMNKMQRYLALVGMTVKTLTPNVQDPTNHFDTQVKYISAAKQIPARILLGSERGELASSQDRENWNDRLNRRQDKHISPCIIRPLIDRLIQVGVLPLPAEGKYTIKWPELNKPTAAELADRATKLTAAIKDYVSSGASALIEPLDFLVTILGLEEEEAKSIIDNALTQMISEQAGGDVLLGQGQGAGQGSGSGSASGSNSGFVGNEGPDFFDESHTQNVWSDEARAAALASRRGHAHGKSKGGGGSGGHGGGSASETYSVHIIDAEGEKAPLTKQVQEHIKGFGLSASTLHETLGVPKGTKLHITDSSDSHISVSAEGKDAKGGQFSVSRTLVKDSSGKWIKNENFEVEKQGTGLGTKIFASQVENLTGRGFSRIETVAARSQDQVGYSVWPKLGYEGSIPAHLVGAWPMAVKSELKRSPKTISDLMKTKSGREWWKEKGTTVELKFDLSAGSQSRKVLDAYKKEKGL